MNSMQLTQILRKVGLPLILVVILGFMLFIFSRVIDVTAPIRSGALSECLFRTLFGQCAKYVDFYKLFLIIAYFLVWALIAKLTTFLLFGFGTKKQILQVVIIAIISTIPYFLTTFFLGGIRARAAQALIILCEVLLLRRRLKNEAGEKRIVGATITAGVLFIFLITILASHKLWPLPFFSF